MIHNNIPKPEISPQFTLEDIHKIRYWNYLRLKDATAEERVADTNRRGREAWANFDAWRAEHHRTQEAPV
jgi:hypothetical protein